MKPSPENIVNELAIVAAKNLAMDSAHIPLISGEIMKAIPLEELVKLFVETREYARQYVAGEKPSFGDVAVALDGILDAFKKRGI